MSEDLNNNSVKSGGLNCLCTLLSSLSTFKIDIWPDSPSASQSARIKWLIVLDLKKKKNIALFELLQWKTRMAGRWKTNLLSSFELSVVENMQQLWIYLCIWHHHSITDCLVLHFSCCKVRWRSTVQGVVRQIHLGWQLQIVCSCYRNIPLSSCSASYK